MDGDRYSDDVVALASVAKHFVAGVPGCSLVIQALAGVSVVVRRGEAVAVVGAPGSGKSTLALCAAGLLVPDSGTVRWGGRREVPGRGSSTAPIFIDARSATDVSGLADYRGGLLVIDSVDSGVGPEARRRLHRMAGVAKDCGALLVLGRSADACRVLVAPARLSTLRVLSAGRLVNVDHEQRAAGRVAERLVTEPSSSVDRSFRAP